MDIDLDINPMTRMKDLTAQQRKAVQIVARAQYNARSGIGNYGEWKPATPQEEYALAIVKEWMLDLPVYCERQRIITGRKK